MRVDDIAANLEDVAEREFPLPSGAPSGHKMTLYSAGSDTGLAAFHLMKKKISARLLIERAGDDWSELKSAKIERECLADGLAHLIKDWTLDDECNHANKVRLLLKTPHLIDWIDRTTSDQASFFPSASHDSESTQEDGRGSSDQPETGAS